MAAPLPPGAEPILKSRMKGFKPADMVIVSAVGPVVTENPLVRIKAAEQYDWRWARGLDVCMYIADEDDWHIPLKAIALQRPEHLTLWTPAGQWGANVYLIPTARDISRPVSLWQYELDFLPWLDFQNQDFIDGRTYGRTPGGVPYAVSP